MKVFVFILILLFFTSCSENTSKTTELSENNISNINNKGQHILYKTKRMSFQSIYDVLLPYLIRMSISDSHDSLEEQITVLNDYLWTWNSVKSYEDHNGLGTNTLWNTSNMLAFDKMYCSEIDVLAATSFNVKHNISRLDVTSHTLYEVHDNYNGRKIMVDPHFNPKVVNANGQLATFEEISNFSKHNLKSLRMNKKEFASYVNLFLKKKFIPQSKEAFAKDRSLRKTTYGERKLFPMIHESNTTMSLDELKSALEYMGISKESEAYEKYIMYAYHIPTIYTKYNNLSKKEMRKFIWDLQDDLLKGIKSGNDESKKGKLHYDIWEARQYQILGRFNIAENKFSELLKADNADKKQINEYIKVGKKLKKYLN